MWRSGDVKALHDLLPPENQHGGSDTCVDFAKVTRENEPRDDDISWVITDDNLTKFMSPLRRDAGRTSAWRLRHTARL